MTLTSAAGALKLTLRCVPSQNGFFSDCPHLHRALETVPSTMIKLGPFSLAFTITFGMCNSLEIRLGYANSNDFRCLPGESTHNPLAHWYPLRIAETFEDRKLEVFNRVGTSVWRGEDPKQTILKELAYYNF